MHDCGPIECKLASQSYPCCSPLRVGPAAPSPLGCLLPGLSLLVPRKGKRKGKRKARFMATQHNKDSSSDAGSMILPIHTMILPFHTMILPLHTMILPFQTMILPFHTQVRTQTTQGHAKASAKRGSRQHNTTKSNQRKGRQKTTNQSSLTRWHFATFVNELTNDNFVM